MKKKKKKILKKYIKDIKKHFFFLIDDYVRLRADEHPLGFVDFYLTVRARHFIHTDVFYGPNDIRGIVILLGSL